MKPRRAHALAVAYFIFGNFLMILIPELDLLRQIGASVVLAMSAFLVYYGLKGDD